VDLAVDECLRRTRALVELPEHIDVDCVFAPGPFRGLHRGGARGTVLVDPSLPFNTADLIYVAAHEAFPGHIAEFLLKERHLADRTELAVRFLPAPAYVLSEGLGLHAHEIIFPGDEAQRWLVDHVDGHRQGSGGDYAAIHRARTIVWGVWCNAAFLAADGVLQERVRGYLERWALLDEDELAAAGGYLGPYIFAYYHGWRLLEPHMGEPAFVRRLLTEQVALNEVRSSRAIDIKLT
jgi:hypothetical protein